MLVRRERRGAGDVAPPHGNGIATVSQGEVGSQEGDNQKGSRGKERAKEKKRKISGARITYEENPLRPS